MMNQPIISVVIPSYNRERSIGRAIESVITQNVPSVEIIVVDDSSTDHSLDVANRYLPKASIKIISHKNNRGIGPSRNSGVLAASGKWILPLDSDDELVPGILKKLIELIPYLPEDIKRVRGMVITDDGFLSPNPSLPNEVWGYQEYLKSLNHTMDPFMETSSIYQKEALLQIPFQNGRSIETLFHLNFFKQFNVLNTDLIFRIYHNDAEINTRKGQSINNILKNAPDQTEMLDEILLVHGPALKKWAPNFYFFQVYSGVKNHLLCGHRKKAFQLMQIGLKRPTLRLFSYFTIGLLGPHILAFSNRHFSNFKQIRNRYVS